MFLWVAFDTGRDGSAILGDIVPVLIKIMMDHPGESWGGGASLSGHATGDLMPATLSKSRFMSGLQRELKPPGNIRRDAVEAVKSTQNDCNDMIFSYKRPISGRGKP